MSTVIKPSDFLYQASGQAYKTLKECLSGHDFWMLLTDDQTLEFCRDIFLDQLDLTPDLELSIPSGESAKTIDECKKLWSEMLDYGMTRNSAVLNLGGGMLSDLGGFVASTYKRGISYYNVPTTLLAMADASFGGKTGVNFDGLKNQIGTFQLPSKVLFDLTYLKTLSATHLASGFAEVMKHALIADVLLWDQILAAGSIENQDLQQCIERCRDIKTNITNADPFEKGDRKKLNFGHTVGHAIEAMFVDDEKIHHGQAIAAGMIAEAWISEQLGLLEKQESVQIENAIVKLFGVIDLESNTFPTLLSSMRNDKKNKAMAINCSLLSKIGQAVIDQEVGEDLIEQALKHYQNCG